MIKVRTKFNNVYDRNQYMNEMFHEFLDVYKDNQEKQNVRKINMEFIRDINDNFERYVYFQRVTTIIVAFMKHLDNMDDIIHKLFVIKESAKKQHILLYACKNILKNVNFDEKYEIPIRVVISNINKRLDYLLALVNSAYIEMTPLDNYKKKLEAEGKSFFDEIINKFPLDEKLGISDDNEILQEYIQKVLTSLSDIGDWREEKEKYQKFLIKKYNLIEEKKNAEKLENRRKKQEVVECKLRKAANDIEKRYMDGMITTHYSTSIASLSNKLYDLRKIGRTKNKIVLLGKVSNSSTPKVYYYSAETEDNMCTSLSKCTILKEHDELPQELKILIEDARLAMTELLFED